MQINPNLAGVPLYLLVIGVSVLQPFLGSLCGQEGCPQNQYGFRIVTAKVLAAKAVRKVEPTLPAGFGRIDANVSVTVVVDSEGNVICAQASNESHPMLRKYCEDAARQWRFKPLLRRGRPESVSGPIVFHIKR